jgi:hypothetical protein
MGILSQLYVQSTRLNSHKHKRHCSSIASSRNGSSSSEHGACPSFPGTTKCLSFRRRQGQHDVDGGSSCRGADLKHTAWNKSQPEWIESGTWAMTFPSSSELDRHPTVQLVARFTMVKPDGTAMHKHTHTIYIYNFNPTKITHRKEIRLMLLKALQL